MTPTNVTTFKDFYRIGKKFSALDADAQMAKKAAPRWNGTDFERDASTAPTDIRLGEVKFGGGRDLADEAKAQLQNYAGGYDFAAQSYEKVRAQNTSAWAGSNILIDKSATQNLAPWSLSTGLVATWGGPVGWQRISDEYNLVVGRWIDETTCLPCDNSPEVKGHLYAQHDAAKGFLWLYAFYPPNADPRFVGATKATLSANFKTAKDLKADLVASPTHETKAVKRPLAPYVRRRRTATATRDRRGAVRLAPKTRPIPTKDFFAENYEAWKEKQKTLTTDFDKTAKSAKGGAAIGALLFDTAMVNSHEITGTLPKDVKGKPPARTAQEGDRVLLNTLLLMSGNSGRFLGALRKTFGGAFVRVINLYEKLRDKFKEFMGKRKGQAFSSKSRLAKVAMKVGGMILGAVVHQLLPRIAHILIQCVETGFVATIEKMFGEDLQTLIGDKIDTIHAAVTKIEDDAKAAIDGVVGSISDDIVKRYEDIIKVWDTASTLISIAKSAFNVARLAACAASGIETVGIGCVVAGVDFVLSLFDVSPSEALAASLLNTCTAQKMIGDVILAFDTIRKLPKTIADAIIEFIRPKLPSFAVGSLTINLSDLLCKTAAESNDLPAIDEVTCGASLSDPGAPEGKDWRPPSEVDLKILNRAPTAQEIAAHGRLPAPGSVPPPLTGQPPPQPPGGTTPQTPTPPTSTPPQDSGSGGKGSSAHGIREGELSTGGNWTRSTIAVDYYIHGKGGGFTPKNYGGSEMTVFITAVSSDATLYGPEEVKVKVYKVFEDPKKKGAYKIEFEPLAKKVLWFKSDEKDSEIGLAAERREGRVGASM
jgi:hypothetical protein